MLIKQVKDIAKQWVLDEGTRIPGFYGAFFHGSIHSKPEDQQHPATSDVDIMVVLSDSEPGNKLGKFIYRDVLLEVSYLGADQLPSPEAVLGQYHLAGSFRGDSVICDPSGQLTKFQKAVAKDFAKRQWVMQRCAHARDKVLYVSRLSEDVPFHDQVLSWLFSAGICTHVLLVAGLKNPTVRRRYAAVRELLEEYGYPEFHEELLNLLGCAELPRERIEHHLSALSDAFDVAKAVIRTPVFFASDISDTARPIAIDGSRDLIEQGLHREAIFWIVATYSRCQKIFFQDASTQVQERFMPGYRSLLADLGMTSYDDLQRGTERTRALLPKVWELAQAIAAANPEIQD